MYQKELTLLLTDEISEGNLWKNNKLKVRNPNKKMRHAPTTLKSLHREYYVVSIQNISRKNTFRKSYTRELLKLS